jgi:hypothetical protein
MASANGSSRSSKLASLEASTASLLSVTALIEEGKALWVAHDTLKSKLEGQQQTMKGGQQSSESIQLQDPTNRVRKPQT